MARRGNYARRIATLLTLLGKTPLSLARRYRLGGWSGVRVYLQCARANVRVVLANKSKRPPRVHCPCCGWQGQEFLTIDCGGFTMDSVECPNCRGQERHRMCHLYLERCIPEFFRQKGWLLHFAPEWQIREMIIRNADWKIVATDYAHARIEGWPDPPIQADMQQLPFADSSLDWLFCLHVLEHVPDDRRGIAELHRVLRPGGTAFIMVPFMMEWDKTVEFGEPDPTMFGHVRGYSPNDFDERLASFSYERIAPDSFLDENEAKRFGIPAGGQVIYRCMK